MQSSRRKSIKPEVDIAVIQQDVQYIKERLDIIESKLEQHYITRDEFDPYKKIITGMVGIILAGALAALLRLIFIK